MVVRRWASGHRFLSSLPSRLRSVWLLLRWDCLPLNAPAFAGRTTGRDHFGHPALGRISRKSMRRRTSRSWLQRNHAQFAKHVLQRELPETRPGNLMPPAEKAANRVVQIQMYRAPRLRDRAIAEVVGPSSYSTVQGAHDFFPWRLETGPQPAPNAFLDGGHRLLRRLHAVVAAAGARRVHRSEGIAEKRKGLASGVTHSGLGLVQREPDAGHPSPSRLEDLVGSVPAEDHKVVSVGDQHRSVPTVQTVFAKRLDEARSE